MSRVLQNNCWGVSINMDQAEKLRTIVKSQEAAIKSKAKMITVTSGKGGVGKSSVSVNLAVQFRKMGYKVFIFDADFGLANVEVMFGAIPRYNLSDVIFHGKQIEEIIVDGPMDIKFVSGGSGISELSNITLENARFLASKLIKLEDMADIIIVDTGAGISEVVMEFVKSSREVILVTKPEPTSITDSYALLKALSKSPDYDSKHTTVNVVSNKVDNQAEGKLVYNKLSIVSEKFLNVNLNFLGYIPSDSNLMKAVMQQKPVSMVYENSKASFAFKRIAEELVKEDFSGKGKEKVGISQVFLNIFRVKSGK